MRLLEDAYITDDEERSDKEQDALNSNAIRATAFELRPMGVIGIYFPSLNFKSLSSISFADALMEANYCNLKYDFHKKEGIASHAITIAIYELYENFKHKKAKIKNESNRGQTVFKKLESCAKELEDAIISKATNFIEKEFRKEPALKNILKEFFINVIKEAGMEIIKSHRAKENASDLLKELKKIETHRKGELETILECNSHNSFAILRPNLNYQGLIKNGFGTFNIN